MALKIEIKIDNDLGPTSLGTPSMEMAGQAKLQATRDGKPVEATWSESSNGNVIPEPPTEKVARWMIAGLGFGKTTIAAQTDTERAELVICVGTVVIAGADGQHWQVFSDGSIKLLAAEKVAQDIPKLLKDNAIVADLTVPSTATAVTCYLLNLTNFAPNFKRKPK